MGRTRTWVTAGYEDFSRGTCGNAGQNLYVSSAGVLQRIYQHDIDRDGYLDLVFCNSQDHSERPPVYVYRDPLGSATRSELPSDGAWSGAVTDLNSNGYDDLILGMRHNGIRQDLNALVYYGSGDGWSERRQQKLPAPACTSVTVGDFNGDGRPDLAFLCDGRVRLFYQTELGFEPKRFEDLDIAGDQLSAEDLDEDGYSDLLVRSEEGEVSIYWGGRGGIDPINVDSVPVDLAPLGGAAKSPAKDNYEEHVPDATPLVQAVHLDGRPHVFVARSQSAFLVPVGADRQFGIPLSFACPRAMAVAVGDVSGDGAEDLVLACRQLTEEGETSWIYWGDERGFDRERRTALPSFRACDVAVGDLDGNGVDDVVLCQSHTSESFTSESLIYRGGCEGVADEPPRLLAQDPRRVFLAQHPTGEGIDIVFVNARGRRLIGDVDISIYYGSPDGFSPERRQDLPGWGAVEAVCTDLNDDGQADLVLANCSENSTWLDPGSYVFLNNSAGFPSEPSVVLPTTRAHGVCCADLNRDGYLDLVFCGFDSPELLVFYGSADGFDTVTPERIRLEHEGTVYDEPRWIHLADLNGNGWLDLVVPQVAYDRSMILWGSPDGYSMEHCQMLSVWQAACARAADLNGNGYLDLVLGGHEPSRGEPHDSFVHIYWNGPDGLREDRRTLLPSKAVNAMAIADFNNDGLLDLFVCSYHDGRERDIHSYLYWNREGKGFSGRDRSCLFTHSASGCVAADFNGNGWVDLAIAYHKVEGDHLGYSAVWWNGPDGFSEDRVTHLPTAGPHGMTAVGPGNIVDRGDAEHYISKAFKLPDRAHVTKVSWKAEQPSETWVGAQLRFADSVGGLEGTNWTGPGEGQTWFRNGEDVRLETHQGQWIQYRLALAAVNGGSSPRVYEVVIHYEEPE